MRFEAWLITVALLVRATPGSGQVGAPGPVTESACGQPAELHLVSVSDSRSRLARALRLFDETEHASEFFRRSVGSQPVCTDSLAFMARWSDEPASWRGIVTPLPATAQIFSNSAYPRDRNNGAVWNGVGVNSVLQAGAKAHWRFLTAALYPSLIYQENSEFAIPVSPFPSEFSYPFTKQIDYPIRMGPESFNSFEIGNSFIEASKGAFAVSFSNENLWIGPSQVHSLIMSNTAPAIPHVRVGTRRPVDLGIARGEIQFLYGSATESDYFDGVAENDSRLFQATFASLELKAVPGLHLGFARVLHDSTTATGQDFAFYLGRLIEQPLGGSAAFKSYNRLGAFYARWALPESGFEAYMEWGREDFAYGFESLLREPDYSQVWAAGFQKAYISKDRASRIYGEVVHLGQGAPTRGGRGDVQFYTHFMISQGHTNRGQLLGASVGIGSDAQTVGYETFTKSSRTGFMVERVRYDDDAYYRLLSRRFGESRHDVELTGEVSRLQFMGPVTLEATVRLSRRYDRHFVTALLDTPSTIETNFGTELTASWTPRW